ncbi:hypothetical protein [Zeaxanthinibacter enoshimensis]|uniref:hypothetical protein n=1 Tax=Zeaxanthinibacter enoshimensis TaxID=392009 RepID=UPI00105F07BF|nr:hypothetical protein [Zeaxanthinibacter enoshimensis]
MKNTNSNKIITGCIYGLLVVFVVGVWIWELREFDDTLANMWGWEKRYEFANVIYTLKITNTFSASIISLSLGLGLFFKNRFGWILITGWFYYLCINLIKLVSGVLPKNTTDLFQLMFISIPICFIVLMNKFTGILEYHNVQTRGKLKLNLFAFVMGILLFAFLLGKKYMLQHRL